MPARSVWLFWSIGPLNSMSTHLKPACPPSTYNTGTPVVKISISNCNLP